MKTLITIILSAIANFLTRDVGGSPLHPDRELWKHPHKHDPPNYPRF